MRAVVLLLSLLTATPALAQDVPPGTTGLVQALGGEGGRALPRQATPGEAPDAQAAEPQQQALLTPLRTKGTTIRDGLGRIVLLRGVNVGLKKAPFLPPHTALDVRRLVRSTGINFVRFSIAWRAVEPAPGRYDQAYLDAMAAAIALWTDAGVYVLVDMHQDVWGGPVSSHGAPNWATLAARERPLSLPAGTPWQARYFDKRVYLSFEALYANQRVPATGMGLADHFARAWAAVARRLAANPRVIGYDPLNEPFYGKEIVKAVRGLAVRAAPSAFATGVHALWRRVVHGEDMQETFAKGMIWRLQNPERYAGLAAGLADANKIVHARLARLYERVGRAIRRDHASALLFVEPVGPVGAGAPVSLPPIRLPGVVYAPHLYDAFMDSGQPYDGDLTRVERTLNQHRQAARRLGAPLVLGEWGNLVSMARSSGGRGGVTRFARDLGAKLDRHAVGSAYWDHEPGAESDALMQEALRPYPSEVAGWLLSVRWAAQAKQLTVDIVGDPSLKAPTVIPIGSAHFPNGATVRADGAPADVEIDLVARQVRVTTAGRLQVIVTAR